MACTGVLWLLLLARRGRQLLKFRLTSLSDPPIPAKECISSGVVVVDAVRSFSHWIRSLPPPPRRFPANIVREQFNYSGKCLYILNVVAWLKIIIWGWKGGFGRQAADHWFPHCKRALYSMTMIIDDLARWPIPQSNQPFNFLHLLSACVYLDEYHHPVEEEAKH